MKSFTFLSIVSLLLLSNLLFAQATQSISGTITDKQSGYPLIGTNIMTLGLENELGTSTDENGFFRLENLPIGRVALEVSYLGYEPAILSNLQLTSAKELVVNLQLAESINELSEIVVKANSDKRKAINTMATVSTRTFSVEEAGRYAGSFGDPSRMAQNYAGVASASDDRNDIIIRGNSPMGVLWRLEGINIPSPNHFSVLGTTGGPVSMLNINNLATSDFMSSAWSADYGNATAGVFDLKMKNGNNGKREYVGQIGFNGFELGVEGPFVKDKNASYIANYRYSTLGVFKTLGIDFGTGAAIPEYQDLTFKLNFPTKDKGAFSVFGIGGFSDISFLAKDLKEGESNLYSNGQQDIINGSKTGVVGASHTYFFDKNTNTKVTVAASGVVSSLQVDTFDIDLNNKGNFLYYDQRQYKYSADIKFNKKLNARQHYSIGLTNDLFRVKNIDSIWTGTQFYTRLDNDELLNLLQGYVNYQHRLSPKTTLNLGIHGQYFGLNNTHTIEPRFGIKYAAAKKQSINFGLGMHSQLQPLNFYLWESEGQQSKQPNKDLDFSKSIHSVLGHDWSFGGNMRLKTEVYYQYLYNIPVDTLASSYSMIKEGASFFTPNRTGLNNDGTGQNYGIELTLEKFFTKGFYFLTTGSFFKSRYTGSDGIERSSYYDSGFVMNGLVGKEFNLNKKMVLSVDSKVVYAGGRRYTPIDLAASIAAGEQVVQKTGIFEKQYDPYFKIDFKVAFRLNGKHISQLWSVDLTNLTNHKNLFAEEYDATKKEIGRVYQRGLFPNILYQIYF